jgi:hypothetical protein
MAADSSSNLEIVISAIDEASAAFDEVSASLEGMSEVAASTSAETDSSLEAVGLTMNQVTGEIEDALLTQQQSFALAAQVAQESDQEIIDTMLLTGTSAEESASIIEEANAAIGTSSEEAATLSKSSFTTIGVAAGLAFAGVWSAVTNAVSAAQEWDIESGTIAGQLKQIGSSIPLSQVQAYAQQIQATTLLTQQQALQSEGIILSYKDLAPQYQNLTSLSADLATKMSQTSGTLADNMPNATKILTGALADPVAGINQLIRQAGVNLPAATVTMIENMAKVGDTAGADNLIIAALQGQVGGLAQAAANAPGAGLTQLSNQLTSLGISVGNALIPDLDALAKALIPIIQDISNWVQEHPKLTEALLASIVVFTALLAVLAVVGIVVAAVGSAFAAAAVSIAAVVAVLVGVIVANWQLIADDTEEIWGFISTYFTAEWNFYKSLFTTSLADVKNIWTTAWTDMSTILSSIWSTIQNTVKTGVDYVISAINGFINALDAIKISIPSIAIPGTKLATPSINLGFSIPDIPMLAEGGFVTQPTLAIIGEAGPEAVMPLSAMGAGGAGNMQQIIININGGVFPADAGTIRQIGNLLANSIVQNIRVKNYAL